MTHWDGGKPSDGFEMFKDWWYRQPFIDRWTYVFLLVAVAGIVALLYVGRL